MQSHTNITKRFRSRTHGLVSAQRREIGYSALRPNTEQTDLAGFATLHYGLKIVQLYQEKFPDFCAEHQITALPMTPAQLLNLTRSLLISLSRRYFPFRENYEVMNGFETNGHDDPIAALGDPRTTNEDGRTAFQEFGADLFYPYPVSFGFNPYDDDFAEHDGYVLAIALWTIAEKTQYGTQAAPSSYWECFAHYTHVLTQLPLLPAQTSVKALGEAATSNWQGADLSAIIPYAFGIADNYFAVCTEEMINQHYPPLETDWFAPDEELDLIGAEFREAEHMFTEFWKLAHQVREDPMLLVNLATYLIELSSTLPKKDTDHASET